MDAAPVSDLAVDASTMLAASTVLVPPMSEAPTAAKCPFPHEAMTAAAPGEVSANGETCPVFRGPGGVRRSPADLVVRRLLRIQDRPAGVTASSAQSAFQKSMMISAIRCTLTYVVFPFLAPAIGFATGVGPIVGVLIGSVAMVCDVFTIRRFFAADHKWRWYFSGIALSIICLLGVLWVQDVTHIVRNLVQ